MYDTGCFENSTRIHNELLDQHDRIDALDHVNGDDGQLMHEIVTGLDTAAVANKEPDNSVNDGDVTDEIVDVPVRNTFKKKKKKYLMFLTLTICK